jgi:competence protein ComEC
MKSFPILKVLVPFISGILFSKNWTFDFISIEILAFFIFITLFVTYFFGERKIYPKTQFYLHLLIYVLFFVLGTAVFTNHNAKKYPTHFSHHIQTEAKQKFMFRVVEMPKIKEKGSQFKAHVIQILSHSNKKVSGNISVFLQCDSSQKIPKYGDILIADAFITKIESPKNPFQFDFKNYYANKNIHHQAFINSEHWISTQNTKKFWLTQTGILLRSGLIQVFYRYFPDSKVRGVVEAIVFGYKDELDTEWKEVFSNTGVMHVLAVSGLHVGIIYAGLMLIFGMLDRRNRYKWTKVVVLITLLFVYCLITGFSPSVSRASLMFSFIAVGNALKRPLVSFNSVFAAGFLLLLVNPYFLFDVGFQFSFLAVLGILTFARPIEHLFWVKSWFVGKLWSLCAVSLAAQIGVLPITLYYFQQFPTYFIVANLVVIPLVTLILYGGLLVIGIGSWFTIMGHFFAKLTEAYVYSIIDFVSWVNDFPWAAMKGITIDFNQVLGLYAIIILFFGAMVKKSKWLFSFLLVSMALFLGFDFNIESKKYHLEELRLFYHPKTPLIGFKNKDNFTIITQAKYFSENDYKYIIEPYIKNNSISNIQIWFLDFLHKPQCLGHQTYYINDGLFILNNVAFSIFQRNKPFRMSKNCFLYLNEPQTIQEKILNEDNVLTIILDKNFKKIKSKNLEKTNRSNVFQLHESITFPIEIKK